MNTFDQPCEHWQRLIQSYIAGNITAAELTCLLEHAGDCDSCSALLRIHAELAAPEDSPAPPSPTAFADMRAGTLRAVGLTAPATASRSWTTPTLKVAAVLLLGVAIGVFIPGSEADPQRALLAAIGAEATTHGGPDDFAASRFMLDNVALREIDHDRLQFRFDVRTHLVLEAERDSPLAAELVARSMLEPQQVSSRLDAVDHAGSIHHQKVTQALLFVLKDDPALPMRLMALEKLAPQADRAEVAEALFAALRLDESTQVRMQALAILTGALGEQAVGEAMDAFEGDFDALRYQIDQTSLL